MKKIILLTVLYLLTLSIYADDKLDLILGFNTIPQGLDLIKKWENQPDTKLYRGIVYHDLSGLELNLEWIEQGIQLLDENYKESKSPIALGYLGSLITIRADYEFQRNDVVAAVLSLDEGGKKIDEAIELDPQDINLRFLRLINGINVSESSPINRGNVIDIDIKFFESVIDKLTNSNKSMFYYYQGRYMLKGNDIEFGLSCLDKSVMFSPKSSYAKDARELLFKWDE